MNWRTEQELSPPKLRTTRTSELNGSSKGGKGDKGVKEFCPGWSHQPGPKSSLLSRLVAPTKSNRPRGLLSWLEPSVETKKRILVSFGATDQDQRPLAPTRSARRWTWDNRLHWFLAQMSRNKDLFYSSVWTLLDIEDSWCRPRGESCRVARRAPCPSSTRNGLVTW